MNKILIIKDNPARLMLDYFPDIQLEDYKRYDQDQVFDIMYRYKVIGRAQLQYRIPFKAVNLKESQTFMVFGQPAYKVRKRISDESGGGLTDDTMLVYLLFRWKERDLVQFEQIFKDAWGEVVMENQGQLQMQLAL